MTRQAIFGLLAILSGPAVADDELAIIVAIPDSVQTTDSFYDVCEGKLGCLAHGYQVILVDLKVTDVLLGSIVKGRMTVQATNGFLFDAGRPSGDNRHLFVLRRNHQDRLPRYVVAEADPMVQRACTVFPIEDYLSNSVDMSIEVPFATAEHCYTLDQIIRLVDHQ